MSAQTTSTQTKPNSARTTAAKHAQALRQQHLHRHQDSLRIQSAQKSANKQQTASSQRGDGHQKTRKAHITPHPAGAKKEDLLESRTKSKTNFTGPKRKCTKHVTKTRPASKHPHRGINAQARPSLHSQCRVFQAPRISQVPDRIKRTLVYSSRNATGSNEGNQDRSFAPSPLHTNLIRRTSAR